MAKVLDKSSAEILKIQPAVDVAPIAYEKEPGCIVIHGKINVPYKITAGRAASKFLVSLRDDKKILAARCPECDHVFVPPPGVCNQCLSPLEEWKELSGYGTLQTYSCVNYELKGHPTPAPLIYGIIQLDGADTGMVHLINEVDLEDISIGMRLEPVFRKDRQGSIMDIDYFRPL